MLWGVALAAAVVVAWYTDEWSRVALSGVVLFLWYVTAAAFLLGSAPLLNEQVVEQFNGGWEWQKSLAATQAYRFFLTAGPLFYLLALLAIWRKPIVRLVYAFQRQLLKLIAVGISTTAMLGFGLATQVHAYKFKTDYTELLAVGSNATVFLVPLMGDKIKQGQIRSEEFYKANLVSTQYVIIPHCQISGTGTFFNDYVNCAQAIVVNRTPVAREWTSGGVTGTSTKNEAFRCETAQSHEVTIEITFAGMIEEANAAKYLYYANADQNRVLVTSQSGGEGGNDKNFISAVESQPLSQFTDIYIRRIIGAELCREFATRRTDNAILEKTQIIDAVRGKVTTVLQIMGVTVTNLGYAGPLSLDPRIQAAIDDTYISAKQAIVADTLKPVIPILEAQARIAVMQGLAESLKNGKLPALPSFIGSIPPEVVEAFKQYVAAPNK